MPLRARARTRLLPALLLAAWSCSHSEPFQDPDETNSGPFSPAVPVQLTYNPGLDGAPAYLPGDTLLVYSYPQAGAINENWCIGGLPVSGGTRVSDSCPRSAAALDSTERYENPVPLNDSIVVLVQSSRVKGSGFDAITLLGTAPWRSADQLVPRQEFPFMSSSGVFEVSANYLSLLGGDNLAYLALVDISACPGTESFCQQPSLLRVGREIALLNLQVTGDPSVAAASAFATSVASGRTPGSFVYTLPFDTKVYERQADGSTVTLFDFGTDSIVRDPMLVGSQMVAIVGGSISRWTSSDGEPLQVDGGGNIVLVTLGSATVQYVTSVPAFQRPVLSANGRVIVAQGGGDLYRFDLP